MRIQIRVQTQDFSVAEEYQNLVENNSTDGAVVSFVGRLRDLNLGDTVHAMTLEHYPGMTESVLQQLAEEAQQRWSVSRISIVHRVGTLTPAQQIVWVGVSSAHRSAAFAACEFLMDALKTTAPFWKKEHSAQGERWLEQRHEDSARAARWQHPPKP